MKHLKMKFAVVLAALLVSGCDENDVINRMLNGQAVFISYAQAEYYVTLVCKHFGKNLARIGAQPTPDGWVIRYAVCVKYDGKDAHNSALVNNKH